MASNGTRELVEVLDTQDRLAANRDTTVQLPYGLGCHPASSHDVGCSPLCEVVMRKLEHPNALLRQRARCRACSTAPERTRCADLSVALIGKAIAIMEVLWGILDVCGKNAVSLPF